MQIVVDSSAWHWRFLQFMNMHGKIVARSSARNTCGYMRQFFLAVAALVGLSALVGVATYYLVVSHVLMAMWVYYCGLSYEAQVLLSYSVTMDISAALGIIALAYASAAGLAVCVLVVLVLCSAQSDTAERLREQITSSSTAQIVSAWHNKICVPIKMDT